ncbi:molybdopterin-binding protein, partial [Methanospirillum sp.]|uniref:molybdopterin molybdotransferase MoeA n=1 Tax=Methanospirillum sp. TaxID=45200 RepID=UPI001BD38932
MSRYLTLIPYLAAQKILKTSARPEIKVKTVLVTNSPGHVSHEPVFSRLTIPVCAVSQRDGYAVTASDSYAATEAEPVEITSFSKVHTGSPVPEGYDAVIMHEDVRLDDPGRIMIIRPARPGQNIQKAGSEVKTGSMVIPAGHRISPADVGALIGYGITSVQVKNIVAGFIPTGDELKEPCTAPGPGEVIASNCEMLASFLDQAGVESVIYPIVPDDPVQLRNAVELAVRECSFVIISGGSSTGNRDHTERVLSEMGTVLYHGVA